MILTSEPSKTLTALGSTAVTVRSPSRSATQPTDAATRTAATRPRTHRVAHEAAHRSGPEVETWSGALAM